MHGDRSAADVHTRGGVQQGTGEPVQSLIRLPGGPLRPGLGEQTVVGMVSGRPRGDRCPLARSSVDLGDVGANAARGDPEAVRELRCGHPAVIAQEDPDELVLPIPAHHGDVPDRAGGADDDVKLCTARSVPTGLPCCGVEAEVIREISCHPNHTWAYPVNSSAGAGRKSRRENVGMWGSSRENEVWQVSLQRCAS